MNFDNFANDQYIWDSPAFPQQANPKEDIVLIVRQDLAVIIIRFLITFIFFLFFLLLKLLVQFAIPTQYDLVFKIVDFVISLIGLGLLMNFLLYFHDYYLSLQIVTTDRVIDIDQKGLFKREVNELAIYNIQDVTHKQSGIIQTFLGFGPVILKTASAELGSTSENSINGFVFENCPEPVRVAGIISDLIHKNKKDSGKEEAITTAEELRKVLEDVTSNNKSNNNKVF